MVDLCSRAYSSYLKYHTRHDCSQKIAKLSIFLVLSFVCFVSREGMQNGVQVNPPSLHPRTHSYRFENFFKYFLKDWGGADLLCFPTLKRFYLHRTKQLCLVNGSAHKCDVCGYLRHQKTRNVIGLLFVGVIIRNTMVLLSCSCLRVEGLLHMNHFCFFSCVVEILTLTRKSKPIVILIAQIL